MQNVIASSNLIQVNYGEILQFNFEYKGFIRWNLEWSGNVKLLIVWEPEELKCNITFDGTEEEYNEYVLPLVQLWEVEKQRQAEDEVLQANLQLEKYDSVIKTYQERIGIALANGDSELVTDLQTEMNSYDPAVSTQDISDIKHYCKKCGHDLDAYNICTNESCKRKQMQDNIVQLVEEQEAKQAQETITSET